MNVTTIDHYITEIGLAEIDRYLPKFPKITMASINCLK